MEIVKYITIAIYIITGFAGLLKLLTYHNPPAPLVQTGRHDKRFLILLFFIYTPEDFAQAKNANEIALMRFSNACAYVFYAGALLSVLMFCFTYSLFFG